MNTAATLVGLRREAVGEFGLADAVTLAKIEAAAAEGLTATLLRKTGDRLPLPQVQLPAEIRRRLAHGQHLPLSFASCPVDCTTSRPLVQVRDEVGNLAGVMRCVQPPQDTSDPASTAVWKAEKWLS